MTQIAPFFTEMEQYIHDSRKLVADGGELEMHGLDVKIERLCDNILELSPDDRLLYEDRLRALLEDLNALGNEMKIQIEAIKEIPVHRNASIAYKTADSRDNFGKRNEE